MKTTIALQLNVSGTYADLERAGFCAPHPRPFPHKHRGPRRRGHTAWRNLQRLFQPTAIELATMNTTTRFHFEV